MSYSSLPFNMFDRSPGPSDQKLANIYHKGQENIWNGKELLAELVKQHGPVTLPPHQADAVRSLFAVILWGELAAWKISAALTYHLVPLEAKLAATAQTHDESRHFYVMHDYLALLGEVPKQLGPKTQRLLKHVMEANTTAKMLLGMQLMIEPMALTLFKLVRKLEIEPVLSDLLAFIEKDEARHIGLGVLYLPRELKELTLGEEVRLTAWQFRAYLYQFEMLKELTPTFEALGISVRTAYMLGRKKQVQAMKMLVDEMGQNLPIVETLLRVSDFKAELDFPEQPVGLYQRLQRGVQAAMREPVDLRK